MTGQRIGYIRVSTFDQNPERQLEGVKVDRAFSDKASGKDVKRPQLEALISFARTGDTVVVHSMDRLARNLDDLRRIVQTLTQRGVHIEFVKEHLSFTGEDSPMANLMLSVMGAFAEFERALIRERQREGIALAKQRGAYRGRKKSLSSERIAELGTVAKLAMRQPFVLFKGLTFQKLCLPGAFRPGDHHNKMLRPGLCVVHASPQYL
ncbi:recombinase family protein [Acinetobacter baumannii]|uniref:recombinase family protein n=2 Tax=Acinetobacter baumannii TaxID=470 RepID=UPI003CCBF4FA